MGDIVHEVEALAADGVSEITLLGQNVNSYGRDLGAGQYRPEFADLLRAIDAVDGIERVRFTSPHPKDLRPETIAAMAECARGVRAPAPAAAVGQRPHARAHAPRLHRRALPRTARRRARRDPRPRGHDRHHRRLPGRDRRRLRGARSRSSTTPTYDAAYTFVFSPRPGTEAADDGRRVRSRRRRRRSACSGSPRSSSARARDATRRASARIEEVLVEGPSKKDPAVWSGRTRQNKLVHFAPPSRARSSAGDLRRRADHRRGAALAAGRATSRRRAAARARAPRPHPRVGVACVTRHLALVGPTASGKSALALAVARRARRRRDRLARLDAGVPRHGHRHREADARRARRGAAPSRRRRRSVRGVVGRAHAGAWRAPRSPTSRRAAGARCSSAGPASTCARSSTTSRFPARTSPSAPRLERDGRPPSGLARGVRAAARGRPGRRGAHRAGQPAPHRARARGDRARPAGRSRRSAPASTRTATPAIDVTHRRDLASPADARATASSAVRGDARRRAGRRGRERSRPAATGCRGPPRRRSATAKLLAYLAGEQPSLDDAFDRAVRAHPAVRPPPAHVVPAGSPHRVDRRRRGNPHDLARRDPGNLDGLRSRTGADR